MIENIELADFAGAHLWRVLEARLRPFVAKRVPVADVDDVVQEVFLRMQRGFAALRDTQRLGPWVYRVARSAIADYGRAAARRPLVEPNAVEHALHSRDMDDRAAEREVATYMAELIARMPEPYRHALILTELEGLTQKQAADRLGVSLSGMKSRVQRGRHKLRAALEACCDIALDARRRVVACEPRSGGEPSDDCCA